MKKEKFLKILPHVYFPLAILAIELFSHFTLFGFTLEGVAQIVIFSLLSGGAISFFGFFLKEKYIFALSLFVLFSVSVMSGVQIVYYSFFRSFFTLSTFSVAAGAREFWRETVVQIVKCLPQILFVLLPVVIAIIFSKYIVKVKTKFKKAYITSLSVLLVIFLCVLFVPEKNREACMNASDNPAGAVSRLGVSMFAVCDFFDYIIPEGEDEVINPYIEPASELETESARTEYNTLDIDFDHLIKTEQNEKIKDMHSYFASVPPTEKNEFTGMMEGKNLIFLCLEGFSHKAIDKDLTPVLYKMYTEGFRFNNFYSSLWGGSTATGEYAVMTGNFYPKAACIKKSADTNQYYSLGNMFLREGYKNYAYHNHTYTYYSRNKSHPNFGYENFKAVGNGLNMTKGLWPNSDEELALLTIDEYITNDEPFHVYYMTVSGHANYNWGGNHMSKRNRESVTEVKDGNENVLAYLACQMEVEKMLREIISKLEEAGKLKDTVFAMTTDHYPYALSDGELSELYGIEEKGIRNNFELYKNAFILWSESMEESVEVDKPCSSYDIVPTIANLFGIEYDSRLITGKDILSEGENIVLLNNLGNGSSKNWITEKGEYDAYRDKFTPYGEMSEEEAEEYKNETNIKVDAMVKYSYDILDNNYYKYIFE